MIHGPNAEVDSMAMASNFVGNQLIFSIDVSRKVLVDDVTIILAQRFVVVGAMTRKQTVNQGHREFGHRKPNARHLLHKQCPPDTLPPERGKKTKSPHEMTNYSTTYDITNFSQSF